jgi:DNA-binding NtrC family response regulator
VDVRVLAATNRDLAHAVRNGSFRQELLHRLAGIRLALPPLRDRNGDVDLLVSHFLDRARAELRRPDVSLAPATRALLSGSRWDGNARELANCLRTLVFEAEDGRPIQPDDLPAEVRAGVGIEAGDFTLPDGMTWAKAQESIESRLHPIWLRAVLRETRGNRSAAAARLGIDRHTLRRLLQRHRVA